MSALFDLRIRQCDASEAADRLIKAFSITRGEMGLDNVGGYVPSRAEAIIINGIAVCYKALGEADKSIELLEKTSTFGMVFSREFDNLIRYEVHQSQIWLIFLSNLKFILARSTPIRYNSIGG